MTLHPQARRSSTRGSASGAPPLWELTPGKRARASGVVGDDRRRPRGRRASRSSDPGRAARGSPARRYRPSGARGTIVWLHGGGWVLDGLEAGDAMCRILANSAAARRRRVDYRVAPEHPFPVRSTTAGRAPLGRRRLDARAAGVGGDSAGGNMSAVCALRARDRGGPALAAQLLVYPVTDHDLTTRVLPRARRQRPAAARDHRDAVVLGPVRARRRAPRQPRGLAAARGEPRRPRPRRSSCRRL